MTCSCSSEQKHVNCFDRHGAARDKAMSIISILRCSEVDKDAKTSGYQNNYKKHIWV